MIAKSIGKIVWCGLLSICLNTFPSAAQVPTGNAKSNSTTYEDDRIKVVIQECARKLQNLTCQAIFTSKSSDRTIELNGNNIKLVDFEGNEYYPTSLRLGNRVSENNLIKTELIENIPFKASLVFAQIPLKLNQIALLQVPLPLSGGINTTAKFRNFTVGTSSNVASKPIETQPSTSSAANISPEVSSDNSLICPEKTKILYRAISKSYLIYICGGKIPTHYVGIAKDGSQGITLRLRYYDRTRFSADNDETNYTISTNQLIISKNNKIIDREKIQVLQALPGTIATEDPTSKNKPKKSLPSATNDPKPKRSSTNQPPAQIKQPVVTDK
jgi:hypothetical protein